MLTDLDHAHQDARRRAEQMRFRHRGEAACLAIDNLRRAVNALGDELLDALEDARALREAPEPCPHLVAVLWLAAHHYTPGASCRTRGGRARAPHKERHDAAKDDR